MLTEEQAKNSRYFGASVELMQVMARALGHDNMLVLSSSGITTWKREMSVLSGINFVGAMA